MSDFAVSPIAIDVITLFPEMFQALVAQGVVRRAFDSGKVDFNLINPREFASNAYKTVDHRPYGGGPGMVMMAPPLAQAIRAARARQIERGFLPFVVFMSPQGEKLTQAWIHQQLALIQPKTGHYPDESETSVVPRGLIVLCGRYEAIDERLFDLGLIDAELSVGDVVLSGGELAAMVMLDALLRCVPGVLNDDLSAIQDSFSDALSGLLDCQHYTRPEIFENIAVPSVLLSGDHAKITSYRRQQALHQTWRKRPDLIDRARERGLLSVEDEAFLAYLLNTNGSSVT